MIEQLDVDGYLTKLNDMFVKAIDNKFHVINNIREIVKKQIPTKFGYKIEEELVRYKLSEYKHDDPLKWGFNGEKLLLTEDGLNNEYILSDTKLMEIQIKRSVEEFESYVNATLAKMTLLGHTIVYYPLAPNPEDTEFKLKYIWKVDDSCISPKGGCVSHILLYPIFTVAIEIGRSNNVPF